MNEIPERPNRDEFVFTVGGEIALRIYEHAVAVRAVKALKEILSKRRHPDFIASECAEDALSDIEASGWEP